MTVSIAIAGAAGRMGRALIAAALADRRVRITGASEHPASPALGRDAGTLAGQDAIGVAVGATVAGAMAGARVWIDFTTPSASLAALDALTEMTRRGGPPSTVILGTTGLDEQGQDRVRRAAGQLVIVQSGNFSLGVNVLAGLVRQAASRLGPGWDIEITEAHHRRKVDAPSGTALLLGEAAAAGRGASALSQLRLAPYDGFTGERQVGGIGFSVVRGGGVVGDHAVSLISELEQLTLSHHARDRSIFAAGAIEAAVWAAGGQAPGLYAMTDVLGL
jgi:4-hydroxy-tetrahydrodipicolinate reductase